MLTETLNCDVSERLFTGGGGGGFKVTLAVYFNLLLLRESLSYFAFNLYCYPRASYPTNHMSLTMCIHCTKINDSGQLELCRS